KATASSNSLAANVGEVLNDRLIAPAVGELRKLLAGDSDGNSLEDESAIVIANPQAGGIPGDPNSTDGQLIAKITTQVQRESTIRRVGLTYVVHVGFSAASVAKADRIANAFIDAYVSQQLGLK